MAKVVVYEIKGFNGIPCEGIEAFFRIRKRGSEQCDVCKKDIVVNDSYFDTYHADIPLTRVCEECCIHYDDGLT